MQEEIANLFEVFDENQDGKISAEEVRSTLQSFGQTKTLKECQALIKTATNGRYDTLNKSDF